MPVTDRIVLTGIAGALVLGGVAAWLLLAAPSAPSGAASPEPDPFAAVSSTDASPLASEAAAELVVDVEGAVVEPGIRHLPAGSRVADALAAAVGYAADADLAASAHALNLAATLADGDQVYVPRIGDAAGAGDGQAGGGGDGSGGLVNLNTASSDALDALPGIGPATIAKILAARSEQPFRTLDELVDRKVLTASQLAGIRDRVTV